MKTWIIFGTSPFITKIHNKIPNLCKKYPTIGLNRFPTAFQDCKYWMFHDHGIFTECRKYISSAKHLLLVGKDCIPELKTTWFRENQCIIKRDFLVKPHYVFDYEYKTPVLQECGKLLCGASIVLPAINYALLQGAEEVILAGIDLNPEWGHFYGGARTKPHRDIKVIKHKIDLFKPHLRVCKANREANLDLEWVDIETDTSF